MIFLLYLRRIKSHKDIMKRALITAMAIFALVGCSTTPDASPVLTIEGGQIQGVESEVKGVTVFKGIPYAAPPIGDLRWKEPQPVVPWEGVKVADKYGHPGYQVPHYPGGYTTEWGYGQEPAYIEEEAGEAWMEEGAETGGSSVQKEKLRLLNENAELKARLESLRQEMSAMEQRLSAMQEEKDGDFFDYRTVTKIIEEAHRNAELIRDEAQKEGEQLPSSWQKKQH